MTTITTGPDGEALFDGVSIHNIIVNADELSALWKEVDGDISNVFALAAAALRHLSAQPDPLAVTGTRLRSNTEGPHTMTMREKMARAIHANSAERAYSWDDLAPGYRSRFLDHADAALAALEEPTEAMVLGALDRCETGHANDGPTLYHDIWRAMIGAAKGHHD